MPTRIDRYALFFTEIDRDCQTPQDVNQHSLFKIFGAEKLRRCYLAVSFLRERFALEWDMATLEDMIEMGRIDQLTQMWNERHWAKPLQCYVDRLKSRDSPSLKRKTIRVYLAAAGGLLETAGVETLGDITQEHFDRYLKQHHGQAASLSAFVLYLKENFSIDIRIAKKTEMSLQKKDKSLVQRVTSLAKRLDVETDPRRERALLATLLADIYNVPLKVVLALTAADVLDECNTLVLWPGKLDVRVRGKIVELLRRWLNVSYANGFVFVGRSGIQPLSYGAVRYHVRMLSKEPSMQYL